MSKSKSRTKEEIFSQMHRELRSWNPEIPESADRMDPVMRILLQLYAHQLEQIDRKVGRVWESSANALIRAMHPESKRWPLPAFTVMRCQPGDAAVEVDRHTRFLYRDPREGGETFYFSPLRDEKILAAEVRHLWLSYDDRLVDLSPGVGKGAAGVESIPAAGVRLHVGVAYDGAASDFGGALLYLAGASDAIRQLRWGQWRPADKEGRFRESAGFCPGLYTDPEKLPGVEGSPIDWGGLRSSADTFKTLENNFVEFPGEFLAEWQAGGPERSLAAAATGAGIELSESGEGPLYWIGIDLPEGGDRASLLTDLRLFFNCFVAVNQNEQTLFKHTGGSRLVEIEIPEDLSVILDITGVVDSAGREYFSMHETAGDPSRRFYALEERGRRLVLWFDFSSGIEAPPDSLTVSYTTTAGVSANGIEAGRINELYESHPGILEVENIIPASGAVPAKEEKQLIMEISARLRSRDRALTFSEVATWARTFDPRIVEAVCANGVERAERGIRRCIVVRLTIKAADFYSADEVELLRTRAGSFLKARSPVNTHYKVEIRKI